jgi:hypothetical protein
MKSRHKLFRSLKYVLIMWMAVGSVFSSFYFTEAILIPNFTAAIGGRFWLNLVCVVLASWLIISMVWELADKRAEDTLSLIERAVGRSGAHSFRLRDSVQGQIDYELTAYADQIRATIRYQEDAMRIDCEGHNDWIDDLDWKIIGCKQTFYSHYDTFDRMRRGRLQKLRLKLRKRDPRAYFSSEGSVKKAS